MSQSEYEIAIMAPRTLWVSDTKRSRIRRNRRHNIDTRLDARSFRLAEVKGPMSKSVQTFAMIQRGYRSRLMLELPAESGAYGFDCNLAIQACVQCLPDFAYPTSTDARDNLVRSEAFSN